MKKAPLLAGLVGFAEHHWHDDGTISRGEHKGDARERDEEGHTRRKRKKGDDEGRVKSPVDQFLGEIARTPLLSAEREQMLARRWRDQKDPAARDELVRANLRLVVNVAKRYASKRPGQLLDLIQEGSRGLIHAVDKFDPDAGNRLSTYATHWIEQKLQRASADNKGSVRVAAHAQQMLKRYGACVEAMRGPLGYEPSHEQMAQLLELDGPTQETIRRSREAGRDPAVAATGASGEPEWTLEDRADERAVPPDELAEKNDQLRAMAQHLEHLEPRHRTVLSRRFGLDGQGTRTLDEIGSELGLTRERVRQIEQEALLNLRRRMGS